VSKSEILEELVRLNAEERREIRAKLNELEGVKDDGWNDGGELTADEKRLIESRIAEHKHNPESGIPLKDFEAKAKKRLGE
jgi:transcription elongation GreA/GreB family factor